jgi:hypothetical protein
MQDVLKTMESPTFIVCTLVVGLILNVISSYLRDGIDRTTGTVVRRWSAAQSRRADQEMEDIFRLGTDRKFNQSFRARNELNMLACVCFGSIALMLMTALLATLVRNLQSKDTLPWSHVQENLISILFAISLFTCGGLYARLSWRKVMLILSERAGDIAARVDRQTSDSGPVGPTFDQISARQD